MKINRRKTGIAFGICVILCVFLACVFHFRWKWKVEDFKKQLRAAGEQLTIAELLPPPVPQEQNSTNLFWQAVSVFTTNRAAFATNSPVPMLVLAPGKARVAWRQPSVCYDAWSNSWEEIQTSLATEKDALDLLRRIVDRPFLDFRLDYGQGLMLQMPHLSPLRLASESLSASTICDLHFGNTLSAVTNIRAMLGMVKGIENERFAVSQRARFVMAQFAAKNTWELLQSSNVTDSQLFALQHDWSNLEFIQAGEHALSMERAATGHTIGLWRKSSSEAEKFFDLLLPGVKSTATAKIRMKSELFIWRVFWSYPDEFRVLKGAQIPLDSIRHVRTNGSFSNAMRQQESRLTELLGDPNLKDDAPLMCGNDLSGLYLLECFVRAVPSLSELVRRTGATEVTRQLTLAAIALKRYQLRLGVYPPELKALVPEFLESVPRDPMDGQALRYRLRADSSFLLYSVGENGVDDGGNPSPPEAEVSRRQWLKGRDVVWPQAASQEEIMLYELEEEGERGKRQGIRSRVVVTNGMTPVILVELERLAQTYHFTLTNNPAKQP